jgi:hypothetical protein
MKVVNWFLSGYWLTMFVLYAFFDKAPGKVDVLISFILSALLFLTFNLFNERGRKL